MSRSYIDISAENRVLMNQYQGLPCRGASEEGQAIKKQMEANAKEIKCIAELLGDRDAMPRIYKNKKQNNGERFPKP